ncbi:MAG TPA: hypothetical protein VNP72_08115 [Longimicrobium sp.]|nr:hypothetical protein [Longimicrobium sp.]
MFPIRRQTPGPRAAVAAPAPRGLPLLAVAWMGQVLRDEFPDQAAPAASRAAAAGTYPEGGRLRLDPLFVPRPPLAPGTDGAQD